MFFRAAVLLPAISLSLKLSGFRATQRTLQKVSVRFNTAKFVGQGVANGEYVAMAVRMVNAAARYGCGAPTCLEKSLALWWLLRRQGTESSVRIGARMVNGKLEAHAWVEREGLALNEPADQHRHYATFDAAFPLPSSEIS